MTSQFMIKDKLFSSNNPVPLICAPFVGVDNTQIKRELEILESLLPAQKPDLIEWRADYFSGDFFETAALLKEKLSSFPLIFTFRSGKEGGVSSADDSVRFRGIMGIIETKSADIVDIELGNSINFIEPLVNAAKVNNVKVILSLHDFHTTLPIEKTLEILSDMQERGADILKVAFTPGSLSDVFAVMYACSFFSEKSGIPSIAVSMGDIGLPSRVVGSCITYGALTPSTATAPGQLCCPELAERISLFRSSN